MLIGLRKSLLKNYHLIFNTDGIQTSFTKANHEIHISTSFHPWSYSPFWHQSHSHSLVIIKAGLTVSCKSQTPIGAVEENRNEAVTVLRMKGYTIAFQCWLICIETSHSSLVLSHRSL